MNNAIIADCPENYRVIYTLDVKNKKLALLLNVLALLIAVIMVIIASLYIPLDTLFETAEMDSLIMKCTVLIVGLIVYLVLHELVHGLFMKLFSDAKVRFGFTGLVAYAASDGYFHKKAYLVIALAPVVIWGVVLLAANLMVSASWFWVVYTLQICNIAGAAGDVFITLKLLSMPSTILIHDVGTTMAIYVREEQLP